MGSYHGPTKAGMKDPCPLALPEVLTLADLREPPSKVQDLLLNRRVFDIIHDDASRLQSLKRQSPEVTHCAVTVAGHQCHPQVGPILSLRRLSKSIGGMTGGTRAAAFHAERIV